MKTIENDIVAGDVLFWLSGNCYDFFGSIGNGRHFCFAFFLKSAPARVPAIRAGSKMECVVLCNFHFCCAFIFCQPMKKFEFFGAPRATRNDILKRVALGTRMCRIRLNELNSTEIRRLNRLPHFCGTFDGSCRIIRQKCDTDWNAEFLPCRIWYIHYVNVLSMRKFGPPKKKKKRGRKAQWLDNHVVDMIDVICSDDFFARKSWSINLCLCSTCRNL